MLHVAVTFSPHTSVHFFLGAPCLLSRCKSADMFLFGILGKGSFCNSVCLSRSFSLSLSLSRPLSLSLSLSLSLALTLSLSLSLSVSLAFLFLFVGAYSHVPRLQNH